jgi:hypothetical protein
LLVFCFNHAAIIQKQDWEECFTSEKVIFQCLEWPRDQVNKIYQRIDLDDRHSNVQALNSHTIEKRMPEDWSIKYLPLKENLRLILKAHDQKKITAYILDGDMIKE